jgi:acyl carrier protein
MPVDARAGIAAALEEVMGRPVEITDDTSIVKDLGLDSLAVMNFIMALEDEYDISMPLDRIAEIDTVGDLARAIDALRNKALK